MARLGHQQDPDGVHGVRLAGVVLTREHREAGAERDLAVEVAKPAEF
jgi:hypothetical protein